MNSTVSGSKKSWSAANSTNWTGPSSMNLANRSWANCLTNLEDSCSMSRGSLNSTSWIDRGPMRRRARFPNLRTAKTNCSALTSRKSCWD